MSKRGKSQGRKSARGKAARSKRARPAEPRRRGRPQKARVLTPRQVADGLPRVDAAAALGVSPSTLDRWRTLGCPQRPDGRYDLPDVIAWRLDRERGRRGSPEQQTADLEAVRWSGKLKHLRYMREAMDLQRERAAVHTREECEAVAHARVTVVRRVLMAMPRKLARRLVNVSAEEAEDLLAHEMRAVCESFARGGMHNPPHAGDNGRPGHNHREDRRT